MRTLRRWSFSIPVPPAVLISTVFVLLIVIVLPNFYEIVLYEECQFGCSIAVKIILGLITTCVGALVIYHTLAEELSSRDSDLLLSLILVSVAGIFWSAATMETVGNPRFNLAILLGGIFLIWGFHNAVSALKRKVWRWVDHAFVNGNSVIVWIDPQLSQEGFSATLDSACVLVRNFEDKIVFVSDLGNLIAHLECQHGQTNEGTQSSDYAVDAYITFTKKHELALRLSQRPLYRH